MYQTWSRRCLVTKSSESLESWLKASECKERLEASSLCRWAHKLWPISLPESTGMLFGTYECEDSIKFRDEAEG